MHIAIIMDGNGRWAKEKGLPRVEGHRRGALKVEDVTEWSADLGVRYLTLYAFSTENWRRPWEEVSFLFNLFVEFMKMKIRKMKREGVRVRIIGRKEKLPKEVVEVWDWAENETKSNNKIDLIIALNYGGRSEIIDAVNRIISENIEKADEDILRSHLYAPDVPDPDIVVRTSGEMRISNFLLWQIAYSELFFVDKYWPDFEKKDLERILEEFRGRHRRFGGL